MKDKKEVFNLANGNILIVEYGLLTTNSSPYFSITGSLYEKQPLTDRNMISCSCIHDDILDNAPQFTDLVALHLSGIDGTPMYVVENGFYHFQTAIGTAQYHTKEDGDREKYTKVVADHLRISLVDATALIERLEKLTPSQQKMEFTEFVVKQRERWNKEAQDAVSKYGLTA